MASYAKLDLLGNVGRDPDVKYTQDGKPMVNFSVACNRATRKNGEWETETEWITVVAFGYVAERLIKQDSIHKGIQVIVKGKLRTRSYDGRDGDKRFVVECMADEVFTTGRNPQSQNGEQGVSYGSEAPSWDNPFGTPGGAPVASERSAKFSDTDPTPW